MMIASNVDPNMVEPFCAVLRVNGERGDGPNVPARHTRLLGQRRCGWTEAGNDP